MMKRLTYMRSKWDEYRLPLKIIIIIAIMVFIIETVVMFFLPYLPKMPRWVESIFDSTILVVFLIPGLYYFVFLPFVKKMVENKQNEMAKQHANDENRAKSVFLTKMSYELRTPLNEVISLSEVVLEDALVKEHMQYIDPIKRINASAKKLLSLIDDIFDISAIESDRVKLQINEVSVKQLTRELQRQCESIAAKNENTFSVSCPDNISKMHTDYIQVKKILWHLLNNCLQNTTGSQVVLSINDKKIQERHYVVFNIVTDNRGKMNAQNDHILSYLSYSEADALQKLDVTALGLTLVRKLITLFEGTLDVVSSADAQCVVSVMLPRYMIADQFDHHEVLLPAACLPQSKIELSSNKALLIVSDERIAYTLKVALQQCGLQVRVATNGVAGLQLAQQWVPSIVILDLLLPDANGWDVLSLLNTTDKTSVNSMIVMSCTPDQQHAALLPVNHYLFKPVTQQSLFTLIDHYCPAMSPATVLTIDQDTTTMQLLHRVLSAKHYSILAAKNIADALNILQQRDIALVILNLNHLEHDTFEFLSQMVRMPCWATTPIVLTMPKIISQEVQKELSQRVERMCDASTYTLESFSNMLIKTIRHFIVIP